MAPRAFTLVIFGATGDLTRRKLVPALYNLFRECQLPDDFEVIGFARREKTDDNFRAELRDALKSVESFDNGTWDKFASKISYHCSEFEDADGFERLRERIDRNGPRDAIFYLAVQPNSLVTVVNQLKVAGLTARGCGTPCRRVIVEKPFGRDLESARELNRLLAGAFDESQIFRIDHYLGKEAVQNLLVFRFANRVFEPVWNREHIDHVQITMAETIGIEGRAGYYEQAGALRDMVQNHMMNLVCLITMEPPASLSERDVRDEKVKVLRWLQNIPNVCMLNGVVRAQYTAGVVGGKQVPGYRAEPGVAPDSRTETFVAFRLFIENARWAGVPFYLRTGKRLAERVTEISVHFKPVVRDIFRKLGHVLEPNVLTIRVQPQEVIALQFQAKEPGIAMNLGTARMNFAFSSIMQKHLPRMPEAYERLLLDAAHGDQTLFMRADEVEAAWEFVEPVVTGCSGAPVVEYPAGSWGPLQADTLMAVDGRKWMLTKL